MSLEDIVDVTELTGLVETDSLEEANQLITQDGAVLLHASFGETSETDRYVLGYYTKDEPAPTPPTPDQPPGDGVQPGVTPGTPSAT